jgi:VanZ family protein
LYYSFKGSKSEAAVSRKKSPVMVAVFWMVLAGITMLAWLPLGPPQVFDSHGDKINHVLAFAVLYLLLWRAYAMSVLKTSALLVLYGFLLEAVQFFLPLRTFEWMDLGADILGVGLGMALAGLVMALKPAPRPTD